MGEKPDSPIEYVVGTSGFSFADWAGSFYPPATPRGEMFAQYVRHFAAVELNFTYYRIPPPRTLERLAGASPEGFEFWVKANQETTHRRNRSAADQFTANLQPLRDAGKLAGVLLQFPQSFHRTADNRKYLSAALEDLAGDPLAVEFRHGSWDHPLTLAGLRDRGASLVVPDVPAIASLFRPGPTATTATGYLRLHSRAAEKWYAGGAQRYDYSYSGAEMRELIADWARLAGQVEKVYAFFNNCHHGQAAENAEAFRRILGQI